MGLFGLLEILSVGSGERGCLNVVQLLYYDEFCVCLDELFQVFEIRDPFFGCFGFPERNFRSERCGHSIELLVGWVVAYHVVARADQRIEN